MWSDYGEELEVRGKKIRVGKWNWKNEISSEELGIAIVELENWVEEIEKEVWEERTREEEDRNWGDYSMGIKDCKGVKLKDEDVKRTRREEVGYMKSRGI